MTLQGVRTASASHYLTEITAAFLSDHFQKIYTVTGNILYHKPGSVKIYLRCVEFSIRIAETVQEVL